MQVDVYVHDKSGFGKRFYKGCAVVLFFISWGLYDRVVSLKKEVERCKEKKGTE